MIVMPRCTFSPDLEMRFRDWTPYCFSHFHAATAWISDFPFPRIAFFATACFFAVNRSLLQVDSLWDAPEGYRPVDRRRAPLDRALRRRTRGYATDGPEAADFSLPVASSAEHLIVQRKRCVCTPYYGPDAHCR